MSGGSPIKMRYKACPNCLTVLSNRPYVDEEGQLYCEECEQLFDENEYVATYNPRDPANTDGSFNVEEV